MERLHAEATGARVDQYGDLRGRGSVWIYYIGSMLSKLDIEPRLIGLWTTVKLMEIRMYRVPPIVGWLSIFFEFLTKKHLSWAVNYEACLLT